MTVLSNKLEKIYQDKIQEEETSKGKKSKKGKLKKPTVRLMLLLSLLKGKKNKED